MRFGVSWLYGDIGVVVLSVVLCVGVVCCAEELTEEDYERLRYGLDPAKAESILKAKSFVCDNGAVVLDMSAVNDDYCDCKDGTDEYGTAACSNGIFTCASLDENGDVQRVFSPLVNDGICDCCDCSDEWMYPQLKKTPCIRNDVNLTQTENNETTVWQNKFVRGHDKVVLMKGDEAHTSKAWVYAVLSSIFSFSSSYFIVKFARRRKRTSVRSHSIPLSHYV